MTMYTITNAHSGVDLGTYEADSPEAALDAMARDGGYLDYTDACDAVPVQDGEIVVTQIRILVDLVNPVSGDRIQKDITGLTQELLDAYMATADNDSVEAISDRQWPADATPANWLAAWCALVGPETAGRVILGS